MAIIRAGGRALAMTDGSREFCSVLETVSANGQVIPPFIVWQGKTHRQSYYSESGVKVEATFAVSESGYMDDELGLQYIKEHFDPYTRNACKSEYPDKVGDSPPRCLIVDGHSSHIAWRVVQYALDHNIHMICLPSKSTHLLQPLDVGCFGVLQRTYEKNLSGWLQQNPFSVISKPVFLEILQKTRNEVYTVDCIVGVWRKSNCWPINRKLTEIPVVSDTPNVSDIRVLDTPGRLRTLTKNAEGIIRTLPVNPEDKVALLETLNFAMEKVTKYRDILPRAETLNKLRTGKVRKEKKMRGKRITGEARVLSYQHVNDGLKKLEEDEQARIERQRNAEERRRIAEERKANQEAKEAQWKVDVQHYEDVELPGWQDECNEINAVWAIAKRSGQRGKRPPYPPRPKRPLKPRLATLSMQEVQPEMEMQPEEQGIDAEAEAEEDLVDSMNSLGIAHFAEVSVHRTYFTVPRFIPLEFPRPVLILHDIRHLVKGFWTLADVH